MNFTERIANAEKELKRVKAMAKVYEMLQRVYNTNFCHYKTDEDTGEYIEDENGDFVYEENEDYGTWDFSYDAEYAENCRNILIEVMTSLEKMK